MVTKSVMSSMMATAINAQSDEEDTAGEEDTGEEDTADEEDTASG